MRDRLADFHIDTGQSPQLVANLLNNSTFRPVGEFKWGFYFRNIGPERMLIKLSTAGLAGHSLYLRHGQQKHLRTSPDIVRLLQGNTRKRTYIDSERALVEGWQEAASETAEQGESDRKQSRDTAQCQFLMAQDPLQGHIIDLLQPTHKRRFLPGLVTLLAAQKETAEYRGQCQRDQCRGEKCSNERDSERSEHPAFHSGKEEERHEADHYYKCGVQYRQTHLAGGIEHNIQHRKPL